MLQGKKPEVAISAITGEKVESLLRKGKVMIGCLCMVSGMDGKAIQDSNSKELDPILQEYADVFKEPTALPPKRGAEHSIVIKSGMPLFKMQPYRYPYMQRKEIEKMVEEMLQSGIIQHSNSPFSSPVLLVKKKDGS